ncbi:MAG: deoxyribodipyrimidine photo-lyase [Bryobacteraceae bacterium]|nr:deoxyribodipyrimidine photo-lyase [Bryobacteraceae bacterium]
MRDRVRKLNDRDERSAAAYVLYWAQMNRRVDSNHALLFAAALANRRELPLLYYEGLTCSYPHASDRLHTFILEGVPETERRLRELDIGYVFYLRKTRDDPNDILYRLAAQAAAVVTDDYPTFIAQRHNANVPGRLDIAYYAVDASCIVPMNRYDKREYAAYSIRPKIRRMLPEFLRPAEPVCVARPFREPLPPFHTTVTMNSIRQLVASCDIDHGVAPSVAFRGGRRDALDRLERFLSENLRRYERCRNEPSARATSDLSPYLHFGHISSLEAALAAKAYAGAHGFPADGFLEELIVRRELAFNFARFTGNFASLSALPDWPKETLRKHAADKRSPVYRREDFEGARTHDALWNAAQKEMLLAGKIHGYCRMYWGKKIIEWSRTCQDALETMIYIHDRYALDGRDPNTYANILWCFGLHDRPWRERPVFGMVRYMSLEGMKRKTDVDAYIRQIESLERTVRDPHHIQ